MVVFLFALALRMTIHHSGGPERQGKNDQIGSDFPISTVENATFCQVMSSVLFVSNWRWMTAVPVVWPLSFVYSVEPLRASRR
jgi:hypothetical protein